MAILIDTIGFEYHRIDLEIVDELAHWNVYWSKKHINSETRITITTHSDADLVVCFNNHLDSNKQRVDLDIDIGANAVEYKAIAKEESLSELKIKMMRLEGFFFDFLGTQLLKLREAKMQDTNESTNSRAKNFTIFDGAILGYQHPGWSFPMLPTRGMDMEDGAMAKIKTRPYDDYQEDRVYGFISRPIVVVGVKPKAHTKLFAGCKVNFDQADLKLGAL
ncbi:emp24/gp25L/p24 family/GOLD-domain-containing protein [Phakopsora pachyrhizi]|uniref:Emp24/gp25L/p24 family/GOLD-domain-containing protein n=1 Tax=Phakopsora pachyrhizi TaxID=170000 RepID=A0AAV0AZ68_PHAPC|nr:emp24/gp25L/p24 family/GOLD-domain-containing protein [Phakopsora pachyrhizi]